VFNMLLSPFEVFGIKGITIFSKRVKKLIKNKIRQKEIENIILRIVIP